MKPKLLLLAALASIVASFDCTKAYAQRPGGPDLGGAPAGESKPAPKPRTRWQKPLQLPEQFKSKDKDKDGQIGMYEWPRNDFATFRKLDLNHDGFLTAAELTRGSSSKGSPPVASAASSPTRPDSSSPRRKRRPRRQRPARNLLPNLLMTRRMRTKMATSRRHRQKQNLPLPQRRRRAPVVAKPNVNGKLLTRTRTGKSRKKNGVAATSPGRNFAMRDLPSRSR